MSEDPRVQQLIEEILDSGISVEEACRDRPDLLPQVRDGWRRFRAMEARLGELFPDPGPRDDDIAAMPGGDLPHIPGYELVEMLGRGGAGIVYKAVHLPLNRTIALKMLLAGTFATQAERHRFAREAETLAGLCHPNIVQVHDVGDCDSRPFFTMEFVGGGSLAEVISGTPQPSRRAAELLAILARAIHAAHQKGVIHRDLKPSNVLIDGDRTPKIADFGLARHLAADSSLTLSGSAVGTPSYMAPEQALGRAGETGLAGDLYSLGAVLYELLTGRPPFRGETAVETVHQVITQDPVPPARLNATVPRDLETICLKCLHKRPEHRYAGAAELAEDLERFLRGEAIRARPENRIQRVARKVRRRPGLSAAVAAASLLSAAVVVGVFWMASERAATARGLAAEEAAAERAAEEHLHEMSAWLRKSSWDDAAAALERARGRLGDRGSPELRRRLDQKARELQFATGVETIRLDLAARNGGDSLAPHWAGQYIKALRDAGIATPGERPELVAVRVRSSDIRSSILATVEECATLTPEEWQRTWCLEIAGLADDDPTGWRARVRAQADSSARAVLVDLASAAPLSTRDIPSILRLAQRMHVIGADPVPLLRRAQRTHPADFWVNYLLGHVLSLKRDYAEALRFLQAAATSRPDAGLIHNELGLTLSDAGRYDEAIEELQRALATDPNASAGHHNLAVAFLHARRWDEAVEQSRIAARLMPDVAQVQRSLGTGLESSGRVEDAVVAYRRALAIDPKLGSAATELRRLLIRLGRAPEARVTWGRYLATDPPDHDEWYGYAELCCHLGLEDEYRRARRELLAKFGDSTAPFIAERTARACLLRPPTDDELRRIVALAERTWSVNPSEYGATYAHFLFLRGLVEYRRGRWDEAITSMQGKAAQVLGPAPGLVQAMAQHRSGRPAEARTALAEAIRSHDWRAERARDQDEWIYHALRREAESMIGPDPAGDTRQQHDGGL